MVFSSEIFLFGFLPVTILGYYLINPGYRNIFLLIMSLAFYAWGEPKFFPVLVISILINYVFGLLVDKYRKKGCVKGILTLMVIFNLSIMFVFKYLDFTIANINRIAGSELLALRNIALPIGISFFTFQAMSYVVDVYRGEPVQKNPLNVGLYITFFPQLIAGPIVRYETVAKEISSRKESLSDFSTGLQRFCCGLAKKVIVSNNLAVIADKVFDAADLSGYSVSIFWLGSIAYTLQIYFDFSGYSDMAIGLGKMFGFHFNENFNYPYTAASITDFWRKWHISLSTWFRDYVYIPLGGSKCSKWKSYRNLACVWILTGIWHGANWTFILWGILYLILLVMEKSTPILSWIKKSGVFAVCYRIFTLFCVNTAWVLFRADSLSGAGTYLASMFGINRISWNNVLGTYMWRDAAVLLAVAAVLSCPVKRLLERAIGRMPMMTRIIQVFGSMFLLILSIAYMVRTSYDPFIYFNF